MPDSPRRAIFPGADRRDRSLSDMVYEAVLTRIADGIYAENARLPAETQLSEDLRVSRPVLRQALKQLREDGIITSRQGSGSFVQRRPDRAMLSFAPIGSIADIQRTFEFRAIIEAEAAALAAARRTPSHLDTIRAALAALERCIACGSLGADEDEAFHHAVALAADNHYFLATLISMKPQILAGMQLTRSLSLTRPSARLVLVQDEHRAVLAAIEAADPAAARAAMRAHVEGARARVFDGAPPARDDPGAPRPEA